MGDRAGQSPQAAIGDSSPESAREQRSPPRARRIQAEARSRIPTHTPVHCCVLTGGAAALHQPAAGRGPARARRSRLRTPGAVVVPDSAPCATPATASACALASATAVAPAAGAADPPPETAPPLFLNARPSPGPLPAPSLSPDTPASHGRAAPLRAPVAKDPRRRGAPPDDPCLDKPCLDEPCPGYACPGYACPGDACPGDACPGDACPRDRRTLQPRRPSLLTRRSPSSSRSAASGPPGRREPGVGPERGWTEIITPQ